MPTHSDTIAEEMAAALSAHDADQRFNAIFKSVYESIRYHNYPPSEKDTPDIEDVSRAPGPQHMRIAVTQHGETEWHQRYPHGVNANAPEVARLTLNVYPSAAFIGELDAFCIQHNTLYKVIAGNEAWNSRHDPVHIHLHTKPTPEIYEALSRIAAPFIRGGAHIGKEVAAGVYLHRPLRPPQMQRLINDAEQTVGSVFAAWLKERSGFEPGEPVRLSNGAEAAVREMIAAYAQHAAIPAEVAAVKTIQVNERNGPTLP